MRKRFSYGTVLVDLERRRPVALLPNREANTLAAWLQEHPGIQSHLPRPLRRIRRGRATWCAGGGAGGRPLPPSAELGRGAGTGLTDKARELRDADWIRRDAAAVEDGFVRPDPPPPPKRPLVMAAARRERRMETHRRVWELWCEGWPGGLPHRDRRRAARLADPRDTGRAGDRRASTPAPARSAKDACRRPRSGQPWEAASVGAGRRIVRTARCIRKAAHLACSRAASQGAATAPISMSSPAAVAAPYPMCVVAAPSPVAIPASMPPASVRWMHSNAVGPTGAATARPSAAPRARSGHCPNEPVKTSALHHDRRRQAVLRRRRCSTGRCNGAAPAASRSRPPRSGPEGAGRFPRRLPGPAPDQPGREGGHHENREHAHGEVKLDARVR